jgi:hypothetical protein
MLLNSSLKTQVNIPSAFLQEDLQVWDSRELRLSLKEEKRPSPLR